MIIREDDENVFKCMESLQGLYDECVIGIDDRPESDNVFKLVNMFPNVRAFRQTWPGRFDLARQDVLNRVNPDADYIGCCDSDEILTNPNPVEIRKYLEQEQPKAVNVAIRYFEDVGPNFKDQSYLRTKIWNTKFPRQWVGWIHEYPQCINEYNAPVPKPDIIFDHLKVDHKQYRSDFIIYAMTEDIKNGTIRWYPYLAQEYRSIKQHDKAIDCCMKYITNAEAEYQHMKVAVDELYYNIQLLHNDNVNSVFLKILLNAITELPKLLMNPVINEYIAISSYYLGDTETAKHCHSVAVANIDLTCVHLDFINKNNVWFK